MGRSAGMSWHARAAAVAMLLPVLALAACASKEDAMAEKLAAAEDAANKAVAAQQAAEKAAAAVLNGRPAPVAEPTVMADTPNENAGDGDDGDSGDNGDGDNDGDRALTMGGEGQTVGADGVVIPGQGV
jgi:membrane protein involved in colicin uptake